MSVIQEVKLCTRCLKGYPLTQEYFYPARRLDRSKNGWQSYCKPCWKEINHDNKERRKEMRVRQSVIDSYFKVMA